jgi:hypothetical protein
LLGEHIIVRSKIKLTCPVPFMTVDNVFAGRWSSMPRE